MKSLFTPFIILIERRTLPRRLLAALTAFAVLTTGLWPAAVHARPAAFDRVHKIAGDLDRELDRPTMPRARWARHVAGVKTVQVVVVSDSRDSEMRDLRRHIERLGGKVMAVHRALHSMTVQIRSQQVRALARHDDVVSVSPNRDTVRSASLVESITGSLTPRVRSNSTRSTYSGLDGTGVGIAVLDSGVMRGHLAFTDANGNRRIRRHVSMLNAELANWAGAGAATSSFMPGSSELATYEAAIDNGASPMQDGYGHGTHVASVAAGSARFYSRAARPTGIAPGAELYDVKVLDDTAPARSATCSRASTG